MPTPTLQSSTPPPDSSTTTAHRPESSTSTNEPLAKRAKPNPDGDAGLVQIQSSSSRSPPSALPFDPAHPAAMASNHEEVPKTASIATDRPSLPSMASLMSPDPNVSSGLPVPPNTAAFPPPSAVGGGPPGMGALGLGLAMHHNLQTHTVPLLQIKLLVPEAKAPTRGSAFAAGYDLYAAEQTNIEKGSRKLVSTGIACAVPSGTYARVAPRSGLAVKHGIATGAGVVDEDYRGEVKVLLFNHGDADFQIQPGDRIAQMVLERIVTPEVKVMDELEESARGSGGFGSTGGFGGQP